VLRSEPGSRQQLPGRVTVVQARAGRPSGRPAFSSLVRRLATLATVSLVLAAEAGAHAPATAIGRAVEAFGSVSVSYEQGAAVTDLEADRFPIIVGSNPKVAFMPASAADELAGGPNAIADEIAREAGLDGTLVVLVGPKVGAWSDEIGGDRLGELVREADARGGPPVSKVETLVRSVQAEPTSDTPWGWIGAGLILLAVGALVAFDRLVRRRH
jgi:hypothetical protein